MISVCVTVTLIRGLSHGFELEFGVLGPAYIFMVILVRDVGYMQHEVFNSQSRECKFFTCLD